MYLLEYNEKSFAFHNNYLSGDKTGFGTPLFSNGWKPVCIIPPSVCIDSEFEIFTETLSEKQLPYEAVVEKVVVWIMNKIESE